MHAGGGLRAGVKASGPELSESDQQLQMFRSVRDGRLSF